MSRLNKYLIVFGDVDAIVKEARRPASLSLTVEPFVDVLKKKYNSKLTTVTDILTEAGEPAMIYLMGFYKDLDDMRVACDERPEDFLMAADVEESVGWYVLGMGKELVTTHLDLPQVGNHLFIKTHAFPETWEVTEANMLCRNGEIKSISKGFTGMLDFNPLAITVFSWLKRKGLDIESLGMLPHLTYSDVMLLNQEILLSQPNAPFTIYKKVSDTPEPAKATLKVVH